MEATHQSLADPPKQNGGVQDAITLSFSHAGTVNSIQV
jgi:hypothetical protein